MIPSAATAATADGTNTYLMSGTIGARRVGLDLTIADQRRLVGGHYFYALALEDIPLSGTVEGGTVRLAEPGGGAFALSLRGGVGAEGPPEDFRHAVGLEGTWRRGEVTLPVRLRFDSLRVGPPPKRFYTDVTSESDAVFEARARRFLRGVVGGDRETAAAAISYPLRVNGRTPMVIRDKPDLLAHWNQVFTPPMLAALSTATPHEMFVHEGRAMTADGAVWFDAKGAKVLNAP